MYYTWPHVLGGVDPEALDADGDEVVDVVGHLLADVVRAAVEVVETDEIAVADFVGVVVVVDLAVRLVEIVGAEGHRRVRL